MTTAAVVLAAGSSTRFEAGHKLIAPFRGKPLGRWAVEHALEARLDDTLVVIGPVDLDLPGEATVVRNLHWQEGLATSLAIGIDAARHLGHDAVVVGLADEPFVEAKTWQAVASALGAIAMATYDGRRGHPVRIHREVWDQLPDSGDRGAGDLIARRPDLVTFVPCGGLTCDIDTVAELARWS